MEPFDYSSWLRELSKIPSNLKNKKFSKSNNATSLKNNLNFNRNRKSKRFFKRGNNKNLFSPKNTSTSTEEESTKNNVYYYGVKKFYIFKYMKVYWNIF